MVVREMFVEMDDVMALAAREQPDGAPGVLSVYLDPSTEHRYEAQRWQTGVNSGLRGLLQRFPDDKKLERTVDTVQRELIKLQPTLWHRGLIYMRSLEPDWTWWRSVHGDIGTRFVWARRPAVFPLLSYIRREPSVGVFVAWQGEVHSFSWRQSVLEEAEHWELDLQTDHWRRFVTAVAPNPARGRQTVVQESRFESRYAKLIQSQFAALAPDVEKVAAERGWEALVVFASDEIRNIFVGSLSQQWQEKVISNNGKHFAYIDVKELAEAAAESVAAWRDEWETKEVDELMSRFRSRGRAVAGGQEVLDLLAQNRVEKLYLCARLRIGGYLRKEDARAGALGELSPLRLHVPAGYEDAYVPEPELIEEIVAGSLQRGVEVVPIHGACADPMREVGGLGAYIRY